MKKILVSTLMLTFIVATSFGYALTYTVTADRSTNLDLRDRPCNGLISFSNSETFYVSEFAAGTATLTSTGGNGAYDYIGKAYINGELVCSLAKASQTNTAQFNYPNGNCITIYAQATAHADLAIAPYAITLLRW